MHTGRGSARFHAAPALVRRLLFSRGMKKKSTRSGRLSLDRATLRALTGPGLRAAQGGASTLVAETLSCLCLIMKDSIIIRTSG